MNNPKIIDALVEMEQNLRNIDSARSQVESVAKKTNDIINEVSKLISSIETLKKGYYREEQKLKKTFAEITSVLNLDHQNKILELNVIIEEFKNVQNEHSESVKSNVNNLNYILIETSNKLKEIEVEKKFDLLINSLDEQKTNLISDFNIAHGDTNEIKDVLNNYINQFSNYINQFNSFEISLLNLQQLHSSKQDELMNFFKEFNSTNSKNFVGLTQLIRDFSTELNKVYEENASLISRFHEHEKDTLGRIEKNQKRNFQIMVAFMVILLIMSFLASVAKNILVKVLEFFG